MEQLVYETPVELLESWWQGKKAGCVCMCEGYVGREVQKVHRGERPALRALDESTVQLKFDFLLLFR